MAKTDLIERLRLFSQHEWETVRTDMLRDAADAIEELERKAASRVSLEKHAAIDAEIILIKAHAIGQLSDAGYDRTSVVEAVGSGDLTKLKPQVSRG